MSDSIPQKNASSFCPLSNPFQFFQIYKRGEWDGAPIVVEKYNLIFFTVPKAAGGKWKQAFRRMEGFQDWNRWGGPNGLPHDPDKNGLKYLYDYSAEKASEMMKNESWTRAIFLRNPKVSSKMVDSQLR